MKHLKTVLRRERLPLPLVPLPLRAQLKYFGDGQWGTREAPVPIYDIAYYAREAVDSQDDFVLIGQDGYGVSSSFFHCYVTLGPLTVLIQAPWGGVLTDPRLAAEGLKRRFDLLEKLMVAMDGALQAGKTLPGRLIVQQSSVIDPRWAWVQAGSPPAWNEEFANALTPALESIESLT